MMKSVVLTSDRPDALAAFYREALSLPLELERHKGTAAHWACQLGDLHFAIHPREGFWLPAADGGGGTFVNFTVEDIAAFEQRLASLRIDVVARRDIGPMKFVAVRDPDGRYVCCGTPWPGARR